MDSAVRHRTEVKLLEPPADTARSSGASSKEKAQGPWALADTKFMNATQTGKGNSMKTLDTTPSHFTPEKAAEIIEEMA